MQLFARFSAALDAGGTRITPQLSEVDLSDLDDVRAVVPAQGSDILLHFGNSDFLERYHSYQEHLPEWRQQYPDLSAVDLRYDRQVVLKMADAARADELAEAKPLVSPDVPGASAARHTGAAGRPSKIAAQHADGHAPTRQAHPVGVRAPAGSRPALVYPLAAHPTAPITLGRPHTPGKPNPCTRRYPMTPKGTDVLAVLDVGSQRTRMLVAELHEGSLRYRGHGVAPSAGMRRGIIADLKPATDAINQASVLAEAASQAVIEQCVAGIGGSHVRGFNSQGGIALGSTHKNARDHARRRARSR